MSAIQDKSNIAIILAMVISTSGYFIGNSDNAITDDKIESIELRLENLEGKTGQLDQKISDHKSEGAHSAQATKSDFFEKMLDALDERVRNIEIFGTKKLD